MTVHCRPIATHHGTVVFRDAAGAFRHGPAEASPRNLFLVNATRAEFVGSAASNSAAWFSPDKTSVEGAEVPFADRDWLKELAHVSIEPADDTQGFALKIGDVYLCAEPNGQITLRERTGDWERFYVAPRSACTNTDGGSAAIWHRPRIGIAPAPLLHGPDLNTFEIPGEPAIGFADLPSLLPEELEFIGEFNTELVCFLPTIYWLSQAGLLHGRRVVLYRRYAAILLFPEREPDRRQERTTYADPTKFAPGVACQP